MSVLRHLIPSVCLRQQVLPTKFSPLVFSIQRLSRQIAVNAILIEGWNLVLYPKYATISQSSKMWRKNKEGSNCERQTYLYMYTNFSWNEACLRVCEGKYSGRNYMMMKINMNNKIENNNPNSPSFPQSCWVVHSFLICLTLSERLKPCTTDAFCHVNLLFHWISCLVWEQLDFFLIYLTAHQLG